MGAGGVGRYCMRGGNDGVGGDDGCAGSLRTGDSSRVGGRRNSHRRRRSDGDSVFLLWRRSCGGIWCA